MMAAIESAFAQHKLVRQARPEWLNGGQSLDGFWPTEKIAFEFQGPQHYGPCRRWNQSSAQAHAAWPHQQRRDRRKARRCQLAGVTLIKIDGRAGRAWEIEAFDAILAIHLAMREGSPRAA